MRNINDPTPLQNDVEGSIINRRGDIRYHRGSLGLTILYPGYDEARENVHLPTIERLVLKRLSALHGLL